MVRKAGTPGGFGRALRRLRTDAGLSQEELAHRADISLRHVGQIERGHQDPGHLVIKALEAALGCDAGDLMRAEQELE